MIRTIYTEKAYMGYHAFTTTNDESGPDSPHGWGPTPEDARADLADQLDLDPCADCVFGPCTMNCGEPA
jgi:hypothetical protein